MSDTASQYELGEIPSGTETPDRLFEYIPILDFAKDILSSIGGVVFQKNWTSGLLIVLALLLNSWAAGLACLFGSAVGTLTGKALKSGWRVQKSGALGLNGALTVQPWLLSRKAVRLPGVFRGCYSGSGYRSRPRRVP
jgi:urea transporter